MRELSLELQDLEATARFGQALAQVFQREHPGVLLFYGGLGAGKTTLTRALVQGLPGGDRAEVSSPSFTICNIYCTAPVVHHFDLYRLGSLCPVGFSDEALDESLDDRRLLTIVEWAEYLQQGPAFTEGMCLSFSQPAPHMPRRVGLTALGPVAGRCVAALSTLYCVT